MKIILVILIASWSLLIPVLTGAIAVKRGRKFWPWFMAGIMISLVANIILLCLPVKSKRKTTCLRAVENDEAFDHLFINKNLNQIASHESNFSATA